MYQQFSYKSESRDQIAIVRLKGYLEDSGGTKLKSHIEDQLAAGFTLFAFDFTDTTLISSPGVAALLDVSAIVVDDNAGQVAVWGFDKHHSTVMEMSGFFFIAEQMQSEEEAINHLKESSD